MLDIKVDTCLFRVDADLDCKVDRPVVRVG